MSETTVKITGAKITGGCLCGSVRYSVTSPPITTRACWCRLCQYLGAGGPTINVCFHRADMHIEGEVSRHRAIADSGNAMQRSFCPNCGTPLFSEAEARPHLIYARAGTLDDPEIAKPAMTIWTSAAPGWACIDESIPSLKDQAPPAA